MRCWSERITFPPIVTHAGWENQERGTGRIIHLVVHLFLPQRPIAASPQLKAFRRNATFGRKRVHNLHPAFRRNATPNRGQRATRGRRQEQRATRGRRQEQRANGGRRQEKRATGGRRQEKRATRGRRQKQTTYK